MFRTLTAKKKIPVQRYLRKGLENVKGTRHLWRAPKYKLKEDEEWFNEWRVKEGKNEIFFDSAPTQEEIRNKIEEEEREEEERKNQDKEDEELKNMSLGEFKKEGEKDFGQLLEESKDTGFIDTSSKQYLKE